MGAKVQGFDPEAMEQVKMYTDLNFEMANNQYDALKDADALLIITEWNEFRNPDFNKVKSLLKSPAIFDGRNVYDLDEMKEFGFFYASIGRQTIDARVKA